MNRSTEVLASAEIAPRVDEVAYDPELHTAYCASGQGKISLVGLEAKNLNALGDIPSSQGCHSVAVDPKTHTVWIAYAKGEQAFAQPFTPRDYWHFEKSR
jgi:hypothetical protein